MGGYERVLVHYGSRAVLLVGFFLVRKLATRRERRDENAETTFTILNPNDVQLRNHRLVTLWNAASGSDDAAICPLIKDFMRENGNMILPEDIDSNMKELFCLDYTCSHLDHGSCGASLKLGLNVQNWFRSMMEASPSRFMEMDYIPALRGAVGCVASSIGASRGDVVPIRSATSAIDAVLRSVQLSEGDLYLTTSLTCPATRSCIVRQASLCGAAILEVALDKDTLQTKERILDSFRSALEAEKPRVKLAVVDHVCSFPPVLMPIQEIAALCHSAGAKVLVDGSNAVGGLPLKIPDLKVQFYTADLHKWFCSPKGAAFLWVDPREQADVKPVVTSHGCGLGFQQEFFWAGGDDMSAWMSVPAVLSVLKKLGLEKIRARNMRLLEYSVGLLCEKWDTPDVIGLDKDGVAMAAVRLPHSNRVSKSDSGAWAMHEVMRNDFNIEVPVIWWENAMWVRISVNLHNSPLEYKRLAQAIPKLQQRLMGLYSEDASSPNSSVQSPCVEDDRSKAPAVAGQHTWSGGQSTTARIPASSAHPVEIQGNSALARRGTN
ncbi:hypothetical protein BSKO_06030 [Bryopsis sp. KO-2023]|nr:hypothetical protein BSKO_06030 [Bryopsis sp. KO-2023]